jgi:hypothetical protein
VRLFGLFGAPKVRPAWNYTVKGAIWHVYPTDAGILVGEERRIEEKKATFFCLDRENGQELWQNASPGDDWWIGIEAIRKDTVLFHGFATPNLPQHRGIIAVDMLTGKKLWEDQQLDFVGIGDDGVIASRETSPLHAVQAFVELDRRSGMQRRTLDAVDLQMLKQDQLQQTVAEVEVKLPVPLERLAADDPEIEAVIRGHCDVGTLAGPVEVVEQKAFVIFDYHELSARGTAELPLLSNVVKVVERMAGTLVYSDTVSTGVHAVVPELFFVQQDMLYYIKERRTLMAVHLASSGVNHVPP